MAHFLCLLLFSYFRSTRVVYQTKGHQALREARPLTFNELRTLLKAHPCFEHGAGAELHSDLQIEDSPELDAIVFGKPEAAHLPKINPSILRKTMRKLGIPFGRKANK
jgi:hypothetical protein